MTENKLPSFEDSIKRVEEITSLLEDGDLQLQERVQKFEEGIQLLRQCEKQLQEAELIIQKVLDKNSIIELETIV
ncbi:MAG: exodeoxyribonuclease VII small subunit [Nanoarchaeota archaeon]|nr:exodeoxyribonuclease VII small subunit [Nanoarchaeota archaeon]